MKKQKTRLKKRTAATTAANVLKKSTAPSEYRYTQHIAEHVGVRLAAYRGLLNGLHVIGYPFTHRVLTLDPKEGSVKQAFEDVGGLLDEAMSTEGRRIGSQANITDREDTYFSTPHHGGYWRNVAE